MNIERTFFVKRLSEYLFLWTLGGILYYTFEMLFRGFSHWSMFALGGICLVFCAQQGIWTGWDAPFLQQVFWCVIFVGACEFITGIIVNKWLGWQVWDYTDQPFQFMGQICLPFLIIFSGLCAFGILLSGYLLHWLYGEKKPCFHVL
nr:putative ABC transporter permease [Mediterraneibacter hominis]